MRHFGAVVGVDVIEVFYRRHHGPMRGIIAFEFVGDEPARFTALAFDQVTKEAHSRLFVPSTLHQNIKGIAVLINRAPEILSLALNRDKDFVDVPGIAQASLLFFELACVGRPKLPAPLPNGFIGGGDASFGEQLFHFTETEAEPMIEPDGVTDDFRGKPMTLVAGCWLFHVAQSAKPELK